MVLIILTLQFPKKVILSKEGIRSKRLNGEIDVRKFQWTKVPFWIRDIDDDDGVDGESQENDDDDAASFFDDFDWYLDTKWHQ